MLLINRLSAHFGTDIKQITFQIKMLLSDRTERKIHKDWMNHKIETKENQHNIFTKLNNLTVIFFTVNNGVHHLLNFSTLVRMIFLVLNRNL